MEIRHAFSLKYSLARGVGFCSPFSAPKTQTKARVAALLYLSTC